MRNSLVSVFTVIVLLFSIVSQAQPNLSGEYWFGSLGADVNTHIPLAKRGTVVVSGDTWTQEWDDINGSHSFTSTFYTLELPDGSVDIVFPSKTYNVAWNGDTMVHTDAAADENNRMGIDLIIRKASGLQSSDITGEYRFFGHYLNSIVPSDSCVWGHCVMDPGGTASLDYTNDHGQNESQSFNWSFDAVHQVVDIAGQTVGLYPGFGEMAFTTQITASEGVDGDLGYNIFVKKSTQTVTLDDLAGTYQVRFLETAPGGVPYTCGSGTCVIASDGTFSVDAYYSDGEHDIFTTDCSVGPGNTFFVGGGEVEGIVNADNNLMFLPEYTYDDPANRTEYDWVGGLFLVREAPAEPNPVGRLFWQALKQDRLHDGNPDYGISIRLSIADTKACAFKGPDMTDYVSATWFEPRGQWSWETYGAALSELQQMSLGVWEMKLTHDDDRESMYTFAISGGLADSEFLPVPAVIEPAMDAPEVIAEDYMLSWDSNGAAAGANDLFVEVGGDGFNYFSNTIDPGATAWNPGWLELGDAYFKTGYVVYRPDMISLPAWISGPVIDWNPYMVFLVSGDKHSFTVKYSLDFVNDGRIDLSEIAILCAHWLEES